MAEMVLGHRRALGRGHRVGACPAALGPGNSRDGIAGELERFRRANGASIRTLDTISG